MDKSNRKPFIPSYRLHKQSGQAIVTIAGRDHLLGKHDTPDSRRKYDRLIGSVSFRRTTSIKGGPLTLMPRRSATPPGFSISNSSAAKAESSGRSKLTAARSQSGTAVSAQRVNRRPNFSSMPMRQARQRGASSLKKWRRATLNDKWGPLQADCAGLIPIRYAPRAPGSRMSSAAATPSNL